MAAETVFSNEVALLVSDVIMPGSSGPALFQSLSTRQPGLKVLYMALNAGPMYKFTEAVSFFVACETQAEIDDLWDRLTAEGGSPSCCGWLKDKFGLSWQIIPTALGRMLNDADPGRAGRVMNAMLQMNKLDIGQLQHAYDGQ